MTAASTSRASMTAWCSTPPRGRASAASGWSTGSPSTGRGCTRSRASRRRRRRSCTPPTRRPAPRAGSSAPRQGVTSFPLVSGETVYAMGVRGALYGLDRTTGELEWCGPTGLINYSARPGVARGGRGTAAPGDRRRAARARARRRRGLRLLRRLDPPLPGRPDGRGAPHGRRARVRAEPRSAPAIGALRRPRARPCAAGRRDRRDARARRRGGAGRRRATAAVSARRAARFRPHALAAGRDAQRLQRPRA